MSSNASRACEQSTFTKKRKLHEPVSYIKKKLRSKIPRRKRIQIAPIVGGFENSVDYETEFSVTQVISNSSCFPDEISSSSNWIPVGSVNLKKSRSNPRKREVEEVFRGNEIRSSRQLERNSGETCQRKTISYSRNKVDEKSTEKEKFNLGVELSETSCVESFSGVEARVLSNVDQFSVRKLKVKARARRVDEKEKIIEGDVDSSTVALSETSCIQPFSGEITWRNCNSDQVSGETSIKKPRNSTEIQVNDLVVTSSLESPSESKFQKLCSSVHDVAEKVTIKEGNRVGEASFSEISKKYVESKLEIADSESTADQIPKEFEYEYSLACCEHFSFEDGSEYSPIHDHEMTLSELESDLFPRIPDSQSSEYTPSLVIESPSDFSERSPESTPPAYFSFLLHYTKQFCKLSSSEDIKAPGREYSEEFTLLRFEDELHEESYRRFRSRERSLVLHDYAEKYHLTTDYGDLVLRQRKVMVNWIVEQANERELQYETMFLGVSLMDRFLSQGFFRNKRNLQMLGVACLALATRIEENQPYNCIRQRTFRVGSNGYSRCEVVAMEWLVQEVLHFQCFLPTTYNFLWFYLKAARANAEVEKIARFLAVLSLLDHERLSYWPSTIAAGLVILAALAANQDASCQLVIETHVRTKNDDLTECIKCLEWLVNYVC